MNLTTGNILYIERYCAAAAGIHINTGSCFLLIVPDGEVRLCVVMTNVCIRHHTIFRRFSQNIIGIPCAVICDLIEFYIVRNRCFLLIRIDGRIFRKIIDNIVVQLS